MKILGQLSSLVEIETLFTRNKNRHRKSQLGTLKHFSISIINNLKFAQFVNKSDPKNLRVGYVEGDKIVDLNKADPCIPTTMLSLLQEGYLDKVKQVKSRKPSAIPLSTVILKAPITGVDKILCIGLNYKDHCEERKFEVPKVPMIFSKFASCLIGPTDPLRIRTDLVKQTDWEIELCVVIGKIANNVKAADVKDYIMGSTVAQDISSRDWLKKNGGQFLLGKAMDTFCPIGPWIVTCDETGDLEKLDIKCRVNNAMKQDSNTNQMIHKIPDVIERLSSVMTLLPGDLILTGTPSGIGAAKNPPEYLNPGDVLHSEIQNIGVLETRVEKF